MMDLNQSAIVIGEVTDIAGKDGPGWVMVKYPHLKGVQGDWCPVVTPMGGPGRGMVFLPEVGDQVLVAREHNSPNHGYVLGCIWSQKQKIPAGDGNPAENNHRFIRSRSGHLIRLDDTRGGERIEFIDNEGARKFIIDSAGKKIQIICDQGDVELIAGSGNVMIQAGQGKVTIDAASVAISAKLDMTIEAGATLTLKGALIKLNS